MNLGGKDMTRKIHLLFIILVWAALGFAQPLAVNAQSSEKNGPSISLPNAECSVKFLVIGDTGRGSREQNELGRVMAEYHTVFPFDTVLLVGDNLYGKENPADYRQKFETPYRALLDRNVEFYASLGNHDESNQRLYEHFNMGGEEYYRFVKGDVAFYALNSNYMEQKQLQWLTSQLEKDKSKWKVAFFHHPPFSSGGRHGSDEDLREIVHPLFVKYNVQLVFTGHDHFYERVRPQDGIQYFVSGAGGKIRRGDIKDRSPLTARGFDTDLSFMLVEITGDTMHFQVISRARQTVDSGVIVRRPGVTETDVAS
jgi:hypothetical protein